MSMSNDIEITDADIEEFVEHGSNAGPSFHPILRVWREVLKPAESERGEQVTAGFANRIVGSYQGIEFRDMNNYRDRYFDKVLELRAILEAEIGTDEDCLSYTTPEEDVQHNGQHYKQLLLDWQLALIRWEKDWDCTADTAAIEVAAISEVHKMFFGSTGIVAFLENIKFEFTEHDQAEVAAALQELKDAGE